MADVLYSARSRLPVFLTRARDNAIELAVYDAAGDLSAPSSGTVDIYDAAGTKVVDGAAVVVSGSKATYTVAAADVPATASFSGQWQVRWLLTMADGVAHTFTESAYLVRWQLKPPASEADLTERHQEIGDLIDSGDDLSQFLRVAWEQIVRRLLRDGRAPSLILDSFALLDLQVYLALSIIYADAASSLSNAGRYADLSKDYTERFEHEWSTITWTYDADGDGLADPDERGAAGQPSLWLAPPRL